MNKKQIADNSPTDNQALKDYLNYYIKLKSAPNYAVFINGPWGSGKTWFIKKYLEENKNEKYIYVSLYGVKSLQEIEDLFFKAINPIFASKYTSVLAQVIKPLAATVNAGTAGTVDISPESLNLKGLFPKTSDKLLVFDDLERCLALSEALGFINRFVEHEGNKVIILGDKSQISKEEKEKFGTTEEKTIGRSFTLTPEFKESFESFLTLGNSKNAQHALNQNYSVIEECFQRSECHNLRILKYCTMEFQRFFDYLPTKAQKHQELMREIIHTFFSLCIEVRSGNLAVADIKGMQEVTSKKSLHRAVGNKNEVEENPLYLIKLKHWGSFSVIKPSLHLYAYFFEYGTLDKEMAREAVEKTSYFMEKKTPPWVRLWHYHSATEKEFETAYKKTIEGFQNGKFTKIVELRHISGLLLYFSKNKIIPLTPKQAEALCRKVVKAMTSKKLIELNEKDMDHPFDNEFGAGLGFYSKEESVFKELTGLIKDGAKAKQNEDLKKMAKKIPALVKKNPYEFWSYVSYRTGDKVEERFHKVPIMQYVDIDAFVKSFLEMNPSNTARHTIFTALEIRYEHQSYLELKEDLAWLKKLKEKLKQKIKTAKQPTKIQLEDLMPRLEKIISGVENYPARN